MKRIMDINCDMGEEWGPRARQIDALLMPFITSCNIACGYHSGSKEIMEATVLLAVQHGVVIGAHPSYKDRENFGRKSMEVVPEELRKDILDQLTALHEICVRLGARIDYVKPHGALYNDLHLNEHLARVVLEAIKDFDNNLKVMVMAGSDVEELCRRQNVAFIREVFSDRAYDEKDRLRSRQYQDAVYDDVALVEKRIADLKSDQLTLHSGEVVELIADSICIHGDSEHAVNIAKVVSHALNDQEE
jgi:UPF0271 protein